MAKLISIIGAGGWGTALATVLAQKGLAVSLWCHGAQTYHELAETKQNRSYLIGITIPDNVNVTRSLAEAVTDKEVVCCAVPSHAVRQVMSEASSHVNSNAIIICGTKGLEEATSKTMGEVLLEIFGSGAAQRLAFISGPTFAIEVAQGLPRGVDCSRVL